MSRYRFSGIADYYKKYRNFSLSLSPERRIKSVAFKDEQEEPQSGSVSPMSTIYHPDRKYVSPTSHLYDDCDDDLKSNESPQKFKFIKQRSGTSHISNMTSIFENIMMNTTVLDGIRMGKLHNVIHECVASDIANFFPIMYVI